MKNLELTNSYELTANELVELRECFIGDEGKRWIFNGSAYCCMFKSHETYSEQEIKTVVCATA
ncbi:MAG: hypothetical protein MUP09_07335 [Thiovulaceae bacterium]|nr:hypothetical protein [Sulfurimonadaceae bacterium]